MRITSLLTLLATALFGLAACQVAPTHSAPEPTAEQMRDALKDMLAQHPNLSVPEFADALKYDHPIERNDITLIGPWNCNPHVQSFDAVLTGSAITLYEVSGRFAQDGHGIWRTIPHDSKTVTQNDSGEFWRASEIDRAGR